METQSGLNPADDKEMMTEFSFMKTTSLKKVYNLTQLLNELLNEHGFGLFIKIYLDVLN